MACTLKDDDDDDDDDDIWYDLNKTYLKYQSHFLTS
jgi:hypothetical protein